MIAVDTNVLVRWILRDDEEQFQKSRAIIAQPFFVSWTVILELAWVLGSHTGLDRARQADVLASTLDLPTLHVDRRDRLRWAIERYRHAGDVADLIHIAASGDATPFVSFEKKLARQAGPESPVAIEQV